MPLLYEKTVDLIAEAASIPSFSTYEDIIHPWIFDKAAGNPDISVYKAGGNNLVLYVQGSTEKPVAAITAHLDKINHFGRTDIKALPVERAVGHIEGQLDDAAGVGICMATALNFRQRIYPTFLVLFSEMEEGMGLRTAPHLLKNNGEGYLSGAGARQIAHYLIKKNWVPNCIVTIDTTPVFKGQPGVALYPAHWDITKTNPTPDEIAETEKLTKFFQSLEPDLLISNNTNDYLEYGKIFTEWAQKPVVNVALEPAIFPYHQIGERVFYKDIRSVADLLDHFLLHLSETY